MSHAIAALSGDPQATRIHPSYPKGRDLGLIMALILKKSSMPIEVLDASTSIGQQPVNRPNSVWDWVYVMPPFPFFCDSLCLTTIIIEFGFKSLSNQKSISRRTPDIGKEFIVLPSNELYSTQGLLPYWDGKPRLHKVSYLSYLHYFRDGFDIFKQES